MDVDKMSDELTSYQITELMAYDMLEPIGSKRLDLSTARICSAIYAAAIASAFSKNKPKPPSAADFMNDWDVSKRLSERIIEAEEYDEEIVTKAETMLKSAGKVIVTYTGDTAPPVKRIGKRAAKAGSKKRAKLDAIFGRTGDDK